MICQGFGSTVGRCTNTASHPKSHKVQYWCDSCELLRRAHITRAFENLAKQFGDDTDSTLKH